MQRRSYYFITAAFLTALSFVIVNFFNIPDVKAEGEATFPAQVNLQFAPNTIAAGGTSVLTISITNPNSFALTLSSVPAALTNTLPTGVTFANPANASTTCTGSSVSLVGSTLSLVGGSVPAKTGPNFGACTISVSVTSLAASTHLNTIPANNLVSTDPTGTYTITNQTPASNNLLVSSVQPPSLSIGFSPNTLWIGQNSTLAVTIRNNDLNYTLNKVSYSNTLPENITISSSSVTSNEKCGSFTATGPGGSATAINDTSYTISNASIAPATSCTFYLSVTSNTAGVYINTIPAKAISSQQGVTNASATSAPVNFQSIGLSKSFSIPNFQVGQKATMTIKLENPTSSPYTGVSFTDTLPQGLSIVSADTTQCNGGTVAAEPGTRTLTINGGTVPSGSYTSRGVCTVSAEITSAIPGSYTNTIPANTLRTDTAGVTNVLPASANVSVYNAGEGIYGPSKAFAPSRISVGGVSTLMINIKAPADTSLTNFSITDALPAGVEVASTPNPSISGCQGGTFTPAAGDTLLTYTGGTIPANQTCALTVKVTGTTKGVFTNTISAANISNDQNRNITSSFSATLAVSGLSVAKAYYPTYININGISTLTITLTNTNLEYLENVTLTDTLSSGLVIAASPNIRTTCGSDTVTANAGSNSITLSGGIIPAQVGTVAGICTINVDVMGTSTGSKTNTLAIGDVTGIIHGSLPAITISNPAPASATVVVNPLSINVVKDFTPGDVNRGSSSVLTVTLTNPNAAPLTGISFSDNLPPQPRAPGEAGLFVANPAHASTGNCGGTITAMPGDTSFTFSGGYLAANTSCSITVDITSNKENGLTNEIKAGVVTTSNGATNALPATATLNNLPGASIQKIFLQNPILSGPGNSSKMSITVKNESNFNLTNVGFYDILPTGLEISGAVNPNQCNGTVAYDSETRRLTLSGANLADEASCTIEVDVTAPSIGEYQNCIIKGAMTSTEGASNDLACDTLKVEQGINPPTISKSFSPNPAAAGATSVLTFNIANSNAVALTGISFTDTFPAGLVVATPPNAAQCNGTVTTTSNSISFSGGTITANSSCSIVVGTKSNTGGIYTNTSGEVSSTNGGTGNTATATLTVAAPPSIVKEFQPGTITRGGISTLVFRITNPAENTVALTNVNFIDNLPAGLEVADPANASISSDCGGAVFSPTPKATSISLSNASIAANNPENPGHNVCTVQVDIYAPNGGSYANTTSAVSSANGGKGNTAAATLTVEGVGLSLDKSSTTANYKAIGDPIIYNYVLKNTGSANIYGPFMITDNKMGSPFECPGTSPLLSGESITCSATYNATSSDITTKSITNTAFATASDEFGSTVTSNNDSAAVKLAKLTLDKTTSTVSYLITGDHIDYTYTLTNTGGVPLYPPFQVSDDHFNGGTTFTCGAATVLPPSGVTICKMQYTVTDMDISNGLVTNTATAIASDAETGGQTITSAIDQVTVYKLVGPVISKEFSPSQIAVGGTSQLTFTLSNPNSTVSLSGVSFSDTFPAGMTLVSAPAASQCGGTVNSSPNSISLSGGSIIPEGSCTVTANVTASTPKVYPNTSSTVTSTNGGNGNKASASLTVLDAPIISKSFTPETILENGTSTMKIFITNPTGNIMDLTGVAFSDSFPTNLRIQNPTNLTTSTCGSPVVNGPGGIALAAGDTGLAFSGGTVPSGGTCTVSVDVTAPSGVYPNTTSVVSSANGGTGVQSNTATLTVNQAVDLSVTKTDSKTAADPSEVSIYTIEVSNSGPSDAVGATVNDTFPSSLTSIHWTCTPETGATCTSSGSGNILDTVNLPAGKKITYTATASVDSNVTTAIINRVSVVPPAGLVDTNEENNTIQDIDRSNRLAIEKTITETDYDTAGEIVHYSYKVTNTGTSNLVPEFRVTDDKVAEVTCSSLPAILAPGDFFTCTSEYTVTQTDVDDGFITNTAYATAHDEDGDVVTSNTEEKSVSSIHGPLIGAAKQVISVNKVSAGTWDITMEILVKNYGNVTLHDIAIEDDLATAFPSPATFEVMSVVNEAHDMVLNDHFNGDSDKNLLGNGNILEVGQSKSVRFVVRVVPTLRGPYTNSATAFGTSPSDAIVEDTSQIGIDPDPDHDLDPTNNHEGTDIEFPARIFDPPSGIKTLNSNGVPVLEWTMVWINDTNIVNVHSIVHDPIPLHTLFSPTLVDSGYPVPAGAPADSTSLGVSCTSSTETVTTLCYYEGPTPENPRGQIIWEGSLGPDLGATSADEAVNAITIKFNVEVQGSTVVSNKATLDSDLNGDGDAADIDLLNANLNERSVSTADFLWDVTPEILPEAGFAPGKHTLLPKKSIEYKNLGDLWLEIPRLGVQMPIVGIPLEENGWDVSWLGEDAGWLNGTAFPTLEGNSVITGHVYLPNGQPGPLINLKNLRWGDSIIVHINGLEYVYQVRQIKRVRPDNFSIIEHEDKSWITLFTCQGYNEDLNEYRFRLMVKAVLIETR